LAYLTHLARLGATNIHPLGAPATARLLAALDLAPGARVLEIGCGTGETLVRVAQTPGVRVDGLDALPAMRRMARRRLRLAGLGRRARVHAARPGAPAPFPAATFDRVYTESVLGFQDTGAARAMLADIYRLLKPGGLYVANEAIWRAGVPPAIVAAINAASVADFGLAQACAQGWDLPAWLAEMRAAGFTARAAGLLADAPVPPDARLAPALVLSAALTGAYRLLGRIHPGLRAERRRYRALLARHARDGRYIEARLFILQKSPA
jgi:SAM-dependent methyltransferase